MSSVEGKPVQEASRLLEAALEQMDGIIQGAKLDNENSSNGLDLMEESNRSYSGPWNLRRLEAALESSSLSASSKAELAAFVQSWMDDNDKYNDKHSKSSSTSTTTTSTLTFNETQRQLREIELERDDLRRQVEELKSQMEFSQHPSQPFEHTGHGDHRHVDHRSHIPRLLASPSSPSELMHYKTRCSILEAENEELRRICSGNRSAPKLLPLSPTHSNANVNRRCKDATPWNGGDESSTSPDEPNSSGSAILSPQMSLSTKSPKGLTKRILGKIRRSSSGSHLNNEEDPKQRVSLPKRSHSEFKRNSRFRATANARLDSSSHQTNHHHYNTAHTIAKGVDMRRPIQQWNTDMISAWLEAIGLGSYAIEVQKNLASGEEMATLTFAELESKLNVRQVLHRKKLHLALSARRSPHKSDPEGHLDHHFVLRWLDDIGLPQYKDAFMDSRVDGRVLNVLTVDDLCFLKVTSQLHHASIRRGIQLLRELNFNPDSLQRRALPNERLDFANVVLWTNHRVMEWLKQVDLAEYAPNLRGSGVHGALLIKEPRFGDNLLSNLLSIPSTKTLLRRHLRLHFRELVGPDLIGEKRDNEIHMQPLTPTAKVGGGQFTLRRKKSKSVFDYEDLVCPFTVEVKQHDEQ